MDSKNNQVAYVDESIFLSQVEPDTTRHMITPPPFEIKSNTNDEIIILLQQLLADHTQINKLKASIHITDNTIQLIQLFLKYSPDMFTKIANDIDIILSDGILDFSDLPQIIVLIKDVYNINFKKIGKKITVKESIQFIQDFILIIIELNYIMVIDKPKVIKIIESSVNLLSSSIQVAPSIFNLCKCCF